MKTFVSFVGIAVILVALALLMAFPTLWLVNYLFAPSLLLSIFGVSQIGFWKALALNLFFGFFVKSSSTNSKS